MANDRVSDERLDNLILWYGTVDSQGLVPNREEMDAAFRELRDRRAADKARLEKLIDVVEEANAPTWAVDPCDVERIGRRLADLESGLSATNWRAEKWERRVGALEEEVGKLEQESGENSWQNEAMRARLEDMEQMYRDAEAEAAEFGAMLLKSEAELATEREARRVALLKWSHADTEVMKLRPQLERANACWQALAQRAVELAGELEKSKQGVWQL